MRFKSGSHSCRIESLVRVGGHGLVAALSTEHDNHLQIHSLDGPRVDFAPTSKTMIRNLLMQCIPNYGHFFLVMCVEHK